MGSSNSGGQSFRLILISILFFFWAFIALKSPLNDLDSLLSFFLFVSVVLLMIILGVVNAVFGIINRDLVPLSIFIACAIVPWMMPRITTEDIYFTIYRKDYERVVELARQHELQNGLCEDDEWLLIFKDMSYVLPERYKYLNLYGCIDVIYDPDFGVFFDPGLSSYAFLFYSESASPGDSCAGYVTKVMAEHWYLCHPTWN